MVEVSGGWIWGVACLALGLGTGPATAHTSFLSPSVFSTGEAEVITLQAAFAEDYFFRPEIAVTSEDFHLYRPDGRRDSYARIETFKQTTVLESDLTEPGTYRFTTGLRLGRIGMQVLKDGAWTPLAPGASPPPGAEVKTSQTATVADVYVTKGAPTGAVLKTEVGPLALRLGAHPSAIFADDPLTLEVLFDGAPLVGNEIEVDREGGDYEEPRFKQRLSTDAQGRVTLRFDRPGVYLIMTRHRAPAPAGSATDLRSYTTSLTFEVTP
ncbi:DUF4198 domain-containing protein [Phenylobacterium sp.]|uniref:DUF4198 domain-containing protein n=1 Tax=Phenylobacterium sp. TaxID=1871053 RepID=UPI0027308751|nr:DUF4198 domain-containing protein [Phenylobacterium sp.]MDP2212939.1 DUF4198 domain-containing protein [Phenylobacterium sp.]